MQKQGKSLRAAINQRPGSSTRDIRNYIFDPLAGTKASNQVEDGNFSLSTTFLEHHPAISPPTNQKKVTHPQPSHQILPIETSPPTP